MNSTAKSPPLGQLLGLRLEKLGQTHAWLARRVGVSREAVSQFLSGAKRPRPVILVMLSQALGLDLDLLLDAACYTESDRRRAITHAAQMEGQLHVDDLGLMVLWASQEMRNGSVALAIEHLNYLVFRLQEERSASLNASRRREVIRLLASAQYRRLRGLSESVGTVPADVFRAGMETIEEAAMALDDPHLEARRHYLIADRAYVAGRPRECLNSLQQMAVLPCDPEIAGLGERLFITNYASANQRIHSWAPPKERVGHPEGWDVEWTPLLLEGRAKAEATLGNTAAADRLLDEAESEGSDGSGKTYGYTSLALIRTTGLIRSAAHDLDGEGRSELLARAAKIAAHSGHPRILKEISELTVEQTAQ